MNETHVTLTGYVGGDVTLRRAGDCEVASFRLATTPRRRSRRSEEWFDAPTQWWTVNAWRLLGRNCSESLHRGDPVVVHGRVDARTWTTSAGVETTSLEIDATFVGHDLNRGTTSFTRAAGRGGSVDAEAGDPTGPGDATVEAADDPTSAPTSAPTSSPTSSPAPESGAAA